MIDLLETSSTGNAGRVRGAGRARAARRPAAFLAAALLGVLAGAFLAGPAVLVASAAPIDARDAAAAVSAPASAAPLAAASPTGWVRLAHLSPDTAAVDVQLTALAGGSVVGSLKSVAYGQVSNYIALPQGAYVVSMAPAGGSMSAPVIQASITIASGQPLTVAAYGRNASLATAIFTDDLTAPAAGQSRIRVVQASTTLPTVNVATSTGTVLASGAAAGTATPYANIAAGPATLDVSSGQTTSMAQVDLPVGQVSTLFVLDNASGGVTVKSVTDASSVGDLPTGGIQTGGGGTAVHVDSQLPLAQGVAGGIAAVLVGAVALALLASRPRAVTTR